jgi:C1A family cysteine protease
MTDKVAATGTVPMPTWHDDVLGGHAITAVGYDDATSRFHVANSWGRAWGNAGYFTLPYQYLLDSDLSDDFWNLQLVEIG